MPNDGIYANAIKNAAKNPVELEYDERKYRRKTKTYESKIGVVTVPRTDITKSIRLGEIEGIVVMR